MGQVRVVKAVRKPHDCSGIIKNAVEVGSDEYWLGTVIQCSCGDYYRVSDSQFDGIYLEKITVTDEEQWR